MKKFPLVGVAILVTWSLNGCGTNSATVSSRAASTPTPTKPIEFKAKEIPIRGSYDEQLKDRATVLQAVMDGKEVTIPKTSSAGITPNPIAIELGVVPAGVDVCNLPYQALNKAMYETCFKKGMSFEEIANITGFKGDEMARSGNSFDQVWKNHGMMSMKFVDNKMVSKAQEGLK